MFRLVLAFIFTASWAFADDPLTGEEFETYTQGRTLTYFEGGLAYGIEEYRPGRQVRWAFDGSECHDGQWWEAEKGLICFAYDNAPDITQCWNFFKSGKGLRAIFMNEPQGRTLYEARASHEPMLCLGPEVGA
ncbi:MAG: hypothetical protein KUG69_09020 [Marinosulfonomonas sp.]|nr:hypothetical protein [Marinosulfonomonas sp.]